MNASHHKSGLARWTLVVAVALTALAGAAGCDEMTLDTLVSTSYPLNAATQNVPSWDGWAQPQYTSSLGLPESPWSYWNNFFGG